MDAILTALGRKPSPLQYVWLVGLFVVTTSALLVAEQLLTAAVGRVNGIEVHAVGWSLWLIWLGRLFPSNRKRHLRDGQEQAYGKAFYRDILPGVSLGVSLMVHPVFHALSANPSINAAPWRLTAAFASVAVGFAILCAGFRTIGVDGAGFVQEYAARPPRLSTYGIYRYLRHPLFFGGIVASCGTCLVFTDDVGLVMAGMNLLVLPIYRKLEDARLIGLFGDRYVVYISSVGGFIPRPGLLLSAVGLLRKRVHIGV